MRKLNKRLVGLVWVSFLLLGLVLLIPPPAGALRQPVKIVVSAGAYDRMETVVSLALPRDLAGRKFVLHDTSGRTLPLQVDSSGQASFVLPTLKAGASKTYRLVELRSRANTGEEVKLQRDKTGLNISLGKQQVLSFIGEPAGLPSPEIKPIFLRGGYIYPVYTPSGHMVTDDYPSDHYHHHGIWFAWTKTEFEGRHPDFWNMGTGSARVEFAGIDDSWSGPVDAGFRSRQRYVDLGGPAPKTALNEQWDVRVYHVGQGQRRYFMFDIIATQQCATASPLILDEYRYGGMGVRGHREWKDKTKVSFLTSEGKHRVDGDTSRGRWCHIGGPVDGQLVGIAVLDHPDNFRAPEPLRLNPDDPYFNYAPSQKGQFEIKPGERFVVRYRYIVADGPPDPRELDRLWNDYAHPPEVKVIDR